MYRYDIIEKIGEGNKGEVYKAKLENGKIVAIKWAKNYDIDIEWEILKFLDGKIAPKPLFRGNRYFAMEYINAKPLKEFLNTHTYYLILKDSLYNAYLLDKLGVNHSQLGRYYHILFNKEVRFIDFERASFKNPRNFLQIIGYYLFRDEKFDINKLKAIANLYKTDKKQALKNIIRLIDESVS